MRSLPQSTGEALNCVASNSTSIRCCVAMGRALAEAMLAMFASMGKERGGRVRLSSGTRAQPPKASVWLSCVIKSDFLTLLSELIIISELRVIVNLGLVELPQRKHGSSNAALVLPYDAFCPAIAFLAQNGGAQLQRRGMLIVLLIYDECIKNKHGSVLSCIVYASLAQLCQLASYLAERERQQSRQLTSYPASRVASLLAPLGVFQTLLAIFEGKWRDGV